MSQTFPRAASAMQAPVTQQGRFWRGAAVAYVAALAGAVIYVFIHVFINGPAIRAAIESHDAEQIDQENTVFCQNFDMARGTDAFATCASHLADIRKRHAERLARDLMF
jgi:anti-sigma-K factor RskA